MVGIVQFVTNGGEQADAPSYNQLRQEVKANNIEEMTVQFDGYAYLVTGKYREISEEKNQRISQPIFLPRMSRCKS